MTMKLDHSDPPVPLHSEVFDRHISNEELTGILVLKKADLLFPTGMAHTQFL